jgi:hypothetical protein
LADTYARLIHGLRCYYTVIKGICRVIIPFHDQSAADRTIPYGMNGAVISWKVLDTPVTNPKKLDHTELSAGGPHSLQFEEENRGKMIYMQWQNERGVRGYFGEI